MDGIGNIGSWHTVPAVSGLSDDIPRRWLKRDAGDAALAGGSMVESTANIPAEVDVASEFRHRLPPVGARTLTAAISRFGEVAETPGAPKEARQRGSGGLAAHNVVDSTASRDADPLRGATP